MYRAPCREAVLLGCLLASAAAPAFDTTRIEDDEVRACADRALPSKTAEQVQRIAVTGADGTVRESRRELLWRRSDASDSRLLMRVLEPPDDRGVAVLINDDATRDHVSYMTYSPKLRRTRRVTGESFFGSILGTDFTYEDFSYFYRADEREEVHRVADDSVDGHPAYVLETVQKAGDRHYKLVRFYIDQHYCLPMRTDFIALNGSLRKQLVVDRDAVDEVDEHWVPFRSVMRDLALGTQTEFIVEEVRIDPDLDPYLFEDSALKRGN